MVILLFKTYKLLKISFHVVTHMMCAGSLILLYIITYLLPILIVNIDFDQLHALIVRLRTHDVMTFGGMNGKLLQKNYL